MSLELNGINKHFSKTMVTASDISLGLKTGEIGALIGPSGCGKTTLLRMIAGFETPDSGRIDIMGRSVFAKGKNLAPEKRLTGMVFQDYALFPHLTVIKNITFGPDNMGRPLTPKQLDDLMTLTGLAGLGEKYPHQLSGGQQQRVALARALAPKPDLLLMDEPFSNLDITLRERLSEEVRHILKQYGTTGLLVTHNQHEAFAMADSIGVMMGGKLLQWDTARNLYFKPVCRQVAGFVGEGSLVRGHVIGKGKFETEMGCLDLSQKDEIPVTGPVGIFIRPEGIVLDKKSACRAVLVKSHFRGPGSFHTLKLASGNLVTCMDSCPSPLELGQSYGISLCICHASIFSSPI